MRPYHYTIRKKHRYKMLKDRPGVVAPHSSLAGG